MLLFAETNRKQQRQGGQETHQENQTTSESVETADIGGSQTAAAECWKEINSLFHTYPLLLFIQKYNSYA